jgi:hypothetical protein
VGAQEYDPDAIAAYWSKRPGAVLQRIVQLLSVSGSFLTSIALDIAFKKVKENEVRHSPPRTIPTPHPRLFNPDQGCFHLPQPGAARAAVEGDRHQPGPGVHQAGAGAVHPPGHSVTCRNERAAKALRQGGCCSYLLRALQACTAATYPGHVGSEADTPISVRLTRRV